MTTFLRVLSDEDKESALLSVIQHGGERQFTVDPISFRQIPGAPFAYWVKEEVRAVFRRLTPLEGDDRAARQGLATADDFRFLRLWWEPIASTWVPFAKGGAFSPFYADVVLGRGLGTRGSRSESVQW